MTGLFHGLPGGRLWKSGGEGERKFLLRGAHAARVLAEASRLRELPEPLEVREIFTLARDPGSSFRRDAETSTRDACAPRNNCARAAPLFQSAHFSAHENPRRRAKEKVTMIGYILRQVLALLAPVGLVWAALLVLTVLLWRRKLRRFAAATGALAAFITVLGSTGVPGSLLGALERPYAGVMLDDLPAADAVVLLGGGAAGSRYEVGGVHLSSAGDRLVMAAELMRLGKAPVLLLGGNAGVLDGRLVLESVIVKRLLARWGVPAAAMLPLGGNADTHDEALDVQALAREHGWHRVLLVTSANHMRRAAATVRHMGVEVVPVPCNFLTSVGTGDTPFSPSVPGADGFVKMGVWLHEEVGWFMYWKRGWLAPATP